MTEEAKKVEESLPYSEADIEAVRGLLGGYAKVRIAQTAPAHGKKDIQDNQPNIMTVRPDAVRVANFIREVDPLYQEEFQMGIVAFARLPIAERNRYHHRESNILRTALQRAGVGYVVDNNSIPSIRFGINPPSRIEVLETYEDNEIQGLS